MTALLGRYWPHLAIAAAVLFGVWWIYSSGAAAAERKAAHRQLVGEVLEQKRLRRIESAFADGLAKVDQALAARIAAIDVTERTIIQPKIEREIIRESRLSDPAAGLTDGLRAAINAARWQSTCAPGPDGGLVCALPPAEPAGR
ncbi:hypothetical protein [Sphingobium boeckii]|uniref:Uncharacterized protein n=1 Tax=Sphingobium boeckii TaxID=1082345 RepID=A0A7W9AF28_9SPHN|nr:hypothetical protein [Sphingobium boeckii]MBB5684279.1 hypothetical protein [Sphingobium boeckii]